MSKQKIEVSEDMLEALIRFVNHGQKTDNGFDDDRMTRAIKTRDHHINLLKAWTSLRDIVNSELTGNECARFFPVIKKAMRW